MSLNRAHDELAWPAPEELLFPSGIGAKLYVQLVSDKLGKAIARRDDGDGVRIGVLATDPESTASPFAIVCEFPKKISEDTLRETQRLAWNFGRAPLLITIEPHIIRKWTCCEPPSGASLTALFDTPEIEPPIYLDPQTGAFSSEQAAASLHWVELLTGEFFQQHDARFKPDKRADQMLLSNLKEVRQKLKNIGLSDDISHDLLARIIFIQFLFDRKDSDGKAALDQEELRRLHEQENVLTKNFSNFGEILADAENTYALFLWLNSKFNGDLFPGKGSTEEQEAAWAAERQEVKPEHLFLLARFVSGEEQMKDGQLSLWPYYAFDAIPLEFISTIYEEFVKKDAGTGVHYTPSHVADLILDGVLPWNSKEWNLKILDPSCGSGVFLVKAFQRLVYRWKNAHPNQRISGELLTRMLEQNIFGVDKDIHAVRTASFSLYLAMCDEIDPRNYWKDIRFPILRGRRLIAEDFFFEQHEGFRTIDGPIYDVVIGNPPWGKNTATNLARDWVKYEPIKKNRWPVSYGDMGPLFIAKALALTKPNGYVGLLQPASTMLYNRSSPAIDFRKKLFTSVQVEEIVNFAALRHILFRDAISPACAIILRNCPPTDDVLWYSCAKPLRTREDKYRIIIEPQDVHQVLQSEAWNTSWIWSALLWGGRRDLAFINRLSQYENLATLGKKYPDKNKSIVSSREGIIRGKPSRTIKDILNKPLLEAHEFPQNRSLLLQTENLRLNNDPEIYVRDSIDFSAFELPQLVIKQTMMEQEGRFRAALVSSTSELGGVLCSHSYLSVHTEEKDRGYLEAACLCYNSVLAVYYLLLTSGRFSMDRNEPQAEALRQVPLPRLIPNILSGVDKIEQVDQRVRDLFGFKEAEWLLIEDLIHFTQPDYKGGSNSPGRLTTHRILPSHEADEEEPELVSYCNTFRRVLHAAYGEDKHIGAVIHSEATTHQQLPVRMVSIFLNMPERTSTEVETTQHSILQEQLTRLYKTMLSTEENKHRFYQRCARTYDTVRSSGGQTGILINLIKPDQIRYWTRSMALRDADEVAADLMAWSQTTQTVEYNREALVA